MTSRARLALALALAAAALPATVAAQSFVAQPQLYQLTTDAVDARALWVQPAGLSRLREASFGGLATLDASGGVSQYGLLLGSGGLGLGWQHDRKVGTGTDVFNVGFAVGGPRVGLGADHRWYRGSGARDGSWDVGARASLTPLLELSLVWRDLGTPVSWVDTLGTPHTIRPTLVPGAALNLFGRMRLGAEWEITTDSVGTSAIRLGASARIARTLAIAVRGDFSSKLDGRAVAIALTLNAPESRATAFATRVKGGRDQVGAWVAGVRDLAQVRRGPFR